MKRNLILVATALTVSLLANGALASDPGFVCPFKQDKGLRSPTSFQAKISLGTRTAKPSDQFEPKLQGAAR